MSQKLKLRDFNFNDINDDDKNNTNDYDLLHKKRGPKKKIIRKNLNITFKLDDSDVDNSSNDKSDVQISKISKQQNNKLNIPWVEKYRPTTVEDLVLEQSALDKIKKYIDEKDMPNIIITGIPGIGKTSTILCIAKNLLGKYYNNSVLELNASDDRGIKTVQQSIEYFCKKKISAENNNNYAKHKIILLDEADHLTSKAQQSINNLMEQYHKNTRFAFTCNNSPEIIEAIQSRCTIFRYDKLSNDQIETRLNKICALEEIPYSKEGIDAIIKTAQGDLRQAINNLQLIFCGYKNIIPENVYKLCDNPHSSIIMNMILECSKKNIKNALKYLNELRNKGYSSSDISLSMIGTIKNMNNSNLSENTKIEFMNEISKTCFIISKGINTPLQLTGCICSLCK